MTNSQSSRTGLRTAIIYASVHHDNTGKIIEVEVGWASGTTAKGQMISCPFPNEITRDTAFAVHVKVNSLSWTSCYGPAESKACRANCYILGKHPFKIHSMAYTRNWAFALLTPWPELL